VLSDDGQVIAFSDRYYAQVCVADAKGVRKVADAQRFALSRDGRYVLTVDSTSHSLQAGLPVTIREVAGGKSYHAVLPDAPPEALFPSDHRAWPEEYPSEVFIEPGPAVVFSLMSFRERSSAAATSPAGAMARLEAMTKAAATPPASWKSTGPVENAIYLRWQPDRPWQNVDRPNDQFRTVLQPIAAGSSPAALPIVEFGCDGWNPRRTVWVRPDGNTVELLRQNDAPGRLLIMLPWMPLLFWNPMYWAYATRPALDAAATDQTQPKARVEELVRQRKVLRVNTP
jgi:hypothetical protein